MCVAGGATESELTEHVLPLVYELHKVTPTMLAFILPEVAEQLKAEDVKVSYAAPIVLSFAVVLSTLPYATTLIYSTPLDSTRLDSALLCSTGRLCSALRATCTICILGGSS